MTKDNLEKSFEFILELEKLKAIQRRVKPLGLERYENSAEHSWQVSLLALIMAKFADNPPDMEKVLKMLLLHDICEIDADDVFFFDEAGRKAAQAKELKAMERILGILPAETGAEMLEIWKEFEAAETREAKFAKAIDRLMPVLQNLYNNRQSWRENDVSKEQILSKTAYISDAGEEVWEAIREKIDLAFA
ncbi:MAG: HD domain-containing protein [Pyrinomonadaceae bacterium]